MIARLIDHTSEATVAYACRVSNPANQGSGEFERLLRSCVRRNEWSVLESSCAIMEINTTRAISSQIIRHRSFTFQEFSQRWSSDVLGPIEAPELRVKGAKKHESSGDATIGNSYLGTLVDSLLSAASAVYNKLIEDGVHPECARMVLPLAQPTRLYMTGSLRSWYHYITLRTREETQKEHRDVALACLEQLEGAFPVVGAMIREQVERD